jgi:hypothetical protein
VAALVQLGFDSSKADAALRSNGYDLEGAANSLLAWSAAPEPKRTATARAGGRYGQFQAAFDGLTTREKGEVEKLAKSCGDPATALQLYIACDKKEASARDLLC